MRSLHGAAGEPPGGGLAAPMAAINCVARAVAAFAGAVAAVAAFAPPAARVGHSRRQCHPPHKLQGAGGEPPPFPAPFDFFASGVSKLASDAVRGATPTRMVFVRQEPPHWEARTFPSAIA